MPDYEILNPYCDICFTWMDWWVEGEQTYSWSNSLLLDWSGFNLISEKHS